MFSTGCHKINVTRHNECLHVRKDWQNAPRPLPPTLVVPPRTPRLNHKPDFVFSETLWFNRGVRGAGWSIWLQMKKGGRNVNDSYKYEKGDIYFVATGPGQIYADSSKLPRKHPSPTPFTSRQRVPGQSVEIVIVIVIVIALYIKSIFILFI